MVDLSRLAKYSLLPGNADIGGTASLIRWQVSGASSATASVVIGGSGHSLQGSPGQRHPVHDARTGVANKPKKLLKMIKTIIFINSVLVSRIKRSPINSTHTNKNNMQYKFN